MSARTVVVTAEECRDRMRAVEEKFPRIAEISKEACCSGHAPQDLADEYDVTYREADTAYGAWSEAHFLLTGETR